MASKARNTLDANGSDIERLHEIHAQAAGEGKGRKHHVEVLNKAAVVFVCAAWEAFCEDLVQEAIDHLVADCTDPKALPLSLRKAVADAVRTEKHEQAPWEMAGEGWRVLVKSNATKAVQKLTGSWNTPKSGPVRDLFSLALGIPDVTTSWKWHMNPVAETTAFLDKLVARRGQIAHRLSTETPVYKWEGEDFWAHVSRLATIVDAEVAKLLKSSTGKSYW
jgi:hypothetical protein